MPGSNLINNDTLSLARYLVTIAGGALTGIVAAMHEQLQLNLKFVIIISAFISRAKQHEELLMPGAIGLP